MTTDNLKNYIVGQKIALYDREAKKFLILKANQPAGEKYEDFWKRYFPYDLPGGRIENGESVSIGLKRDVIEEIGDDIRYTLGPIVHEEQMDYVDEAVYATFKLAYYEGGEVTLSDEHASFTWLSPEEVAKNKDIKPWLKATIQAATEEIRKTSYLEDLKRLQADFENYKKRQAKSQEEMSSYLTEKVIQDLIPILDNFYQATAHVPADQKESAWITGITYIQKQLADVLESYGMKVIEVKEGESFDPETMEAVEGEGEKVAKVHQNGYRLGTRVIKPARVALK